MLFLFLYIYMPLSILLKFNVRTNNLSEPIVQCKQIKELKLIIKKSF